MWRGRGGFKTASDPNLIIAVPAYKISRFKFVKLSVSKLSQPLLVKAGHGLVKVKSVDKCWSDD